MKKAWELNKEAKVFFEKNQILEAIGKLYELQELSIFDNLMLNNAIIWLCIRILFKLDEKQASSVDDVLLLVRGYKFERPSEAYSVLLKAALKHKAHTDILGFIKWWRLKNLRPEDFVPEVLVLKNGKKNKIPATAERAYMAIASALLVSRHKDMELIKAFISQLHNFSVANPRFNWLPYYEARLILVSGESRKEILYKILPFVRHRRRDFWAWELLARLYENEKKIQISCYCKALLCGADEEFLVKVRERFALVLLAQNFLAEAKCEALQLINLKTKQGLKIPSSIVKMQNEGWWNVTSARKNNLKFYESNSPIANELLFPPERLETAIVQGINKDAKIVYFGVTRQKYGAFFYSKCAALTPGDRIEIYLESSKKGKMFKLKKLKKAVSEAPHNLLTEISGEIKYNRLNKSWFIDKMFVPSYLVKQFKIETNCNVKVKMYELFDKKKNKFMWKIYNIKKL